jgi:peptide/nickel transport system permease protein
MEPNEHNVGSKVGKAESIEGSVRIGEFQRFRKVFFGRQVVIFGFVIIFLLIVTALLAPLISPYDPIAINLRDSLQPPTFSHWLGTDNMGRDVLSRLIYGTQDSLMVGLVAVGVASVIGMTLGLLSGYFSGWLDTIVMRIIDALMTIPAIILALVFAAVLGGGMKNVMIAVGIAMMPSYCRLMRGQVLSAKENDSVVAAHVVGGSDVRIMFSHILPNCLPPLIVLITLNLGSAILAEASLSFLGVGITPPTPTWGGMIYDGQRYLLSNPLLSFAPGVCIMLVVLAFNMVGDGLRDALDPRLRGTL